jgi:hypothetical protein
MQPVIGLPPRADPGIANPAQTQRAFFYTWLGVIQRTLQQTRMKGKRCLASFPGSIKPGPACAYTMLRVILRRTFMVWNSEFDSSYQTLPGTSPSYVA